MIQNLHWEKFILSFYLGLTKYISQSYEKNCPLIISFLLFACIRTGAWQPSTYTTNKECIRRYFDIRGGLLKHYRRNY